MFLTTEHLHKALQTLEGALEQIGEQEEGATAYEIFLSSIIQNYELALETSGKLLRKAIRPYFGEPLRVASLTYADLFREAVRHGLLEPELVMRWLTCRNSRNRTAPDYGAAFAERLLPMMRGFIDDGRQLAATLDRILQTEE